MNDAKENGGGQPSGSVWYVGGLRFSCTQCGRCCGGGPGFVWLSDDEVRRIALFLGLTTETFLNRYARRVFGRWSLREAGASQNYNCVMLGAKGCTIYPVRPQQCRTFPFWPENLRSPQRWRALRKFCPGVDHGRLYTLDEIQAILDGKSATSDPDAFSLRALQRQNAPQAIDTAAIYLNTIDRSGIENLFRDLETVYRKLGGAIVALLAETHTPGCRACGQCCLDPELVPYASFLEAVYLRSHIKPPADCLATAPSTRCVYLSAEHKCTAHASRPLSCRTYFCTATRSVRTRLHELYESSLRQIASLSRSAGLPWNYRPLSEHLSELLSDP